MSESQSRYSIIERLNRTKLDIMGAKSDLKEDLKKKQQRAEELRKELKNWEIDVQEDVKRDKRQKELAIDKADRDAANASARLTDKEKVYDNKIKAIDAALSKIEEISKTSQS